MQTYSCPSCQFHISEADALWDSAIDSGRCPYCQKPLRNFPISILQQAESPTADTLEAPITVQHREVPSSSPLSPKGGMWGRLKEAGESVLGLTLLIAILVGTILLISGGIYLGEMIYPWLLNISSITLLVVVLILLPLALFQRTRKVSGWGLSIASWVFGTTLWIWGFLLTYQLWGGFALFIGLIFLGVGVVPLAMLATLFEGMWSTFGELVLVLAITFATRFVGAFVLTRSATMVATGVSEPPSITLSSNYFLRHWRGECSLGISYWLNGGVLAGMVPGVLAAAVSLVEKGDYSLRAISFASLGTLLFSAIAWLWSTVGIWRSAGRHVARGGSSGWASAARVGVVLGTIVMIGQLSTTILPQIKEFALIASGNDPIGNLKINVATNGQSVIVRGILREGSALEVQKILDAAPGATSLVLNSPGGRSFEAQQLARAVRIRHLNTYVEDQCASACTYVFLAGKDRASTPNARIGFHQPHFPGVDATAQREMTNAMLTIYRGAELPEAFIQHIAKTPPEDMWYPTRDELIAAHVITRVSLGGEAAISLMEMRSKQELLLLWESIPLFQAIEKRFPGTTNEAVERAWAEKERGGTDAEVQSSMRSIISEIYPILLKTADVSTLDSYIKLMISEMSAAQSIGGEACTTLLAGKLNIDHTLPREIVEQETQFVFSALASPSATALPSLDRAQFTQAMQKVRANVPHNHLNVVDDMNAYTNQPDLVCEAMIVFFRTIQALPSRERHVVLRGIFQDEDGKKETSISLALPEREPLPARRISQQAREQVIRSEQEESARTAGKESQLKDESKRQAGEQHRGKKQAEKEALLESEATSEQVLYYPEEENAWETKKNTGLRGSQWVLFRIPS